MMTNWNKVNLLDMQKYLEGQVDSIRSISDLSLSENDYKSLGTKLKSLCFFTGSENDIQDMMLSVIVYCTYALIYGDEGTNFDEIFGVILNDSQYLERLHLKMYDEAFYSYGFNRFGYDDSDIKTRCIKMTARHAGIPDDEKDMFFDLICNFLDCNDVSKMEKEIFAALPYKSKFIFSNLDTASRQQIIMETRTLIYTLMHGSMERAMLLKKFPDISINLIDSAFCFVENHHKKVLLNS